VDSKSNSPMLGIDLTKAQPSFQELGFYALFSEAGMRMWAIQKLGLFVDTSHSSRWFNLEAVILMYLRA
jgi:hypothetical protein